MGHVPDGNSAIQYETEKSYVSGYQVNIKWILRNMCKVYSMTIVKQ